MRGLVTLIARSQQYVLAEATRTLSLVSDTQHAAKDGLWFGNSSLPRSQGVSENALDPAPYTAFGPNGESYTAPAFVVNDLAQDERFMDRGYAGRGISFYAGVPISTVSGFAIGVYTVTDDRPRSGLSAEELQFMQDMASTVGNHLDKIGNESARYRGERMVLGLGSFIEGKSTTYGESMDGDQPAYLSVADSLPRQTPEGENRYQQFKGMTITNANPSALRRAWTSEDVDQVVHSSHDPTDGTVDGKSSPPPGDQPTLIEQQNSNEQAHHDRRGQSSLFQPRSSNDAPAPMQPKDLRHTFWRAANIMRECTAADGVIFYNAMNTNEAKGHIRSNSSHFDVPPAQQSEASTPGSSDDLTLAYEVPISRSASSDSIKQASRTASQGRDTKSMNCEKLGFSLSVAADSKASKMSTASLDISEHTLRRFLRRYPRGKLFSYAEDGEVSTSEGDRRHSRSREKDLHQASGLAHPMIRPKTLGKVFAEELLKVIPGARNVIFLPLWDSHKQKWAAGTFVWSRRPGQLLQAQDDLSYLKAFGNSIMSEVARLDAVTADKAKTSFIANISHELRSPLHGILGSIEFLHDTAVDDFQSSLITSIETCGRTLLDTLNNVLTYAKINHLSRRGSGRYAELEAKGNDSGLQNSLANVLETDFDLATVVEEVVEAVYAGQTFRPTGILHDIDESKNPLVEATTPSEDTSATSGSIQRRSTKSYGLVRITLDIEHLSDWRVHSQPGAVRRLVMNILGNALKYTEKGKIQVSLESRQQRSDKPSSLAVCLSITDTGKGMSANFVKNHAFTPFIQEDSFASGTGLGLSIVRQIVNTLGGTVDLQSEQGTGTDVKIWLTLLRANSPQAPEFSGGLLPTVMKQTPGLKICILDPKFAKQDPSTHTPEHDIKDPIERSIRNMAQEWFQMDVLTSSQMNGVAADFFIYAEPPPIEDLLERHGCPSMSEEVPIIIVATSANETASLRASCINHLTESGRIVEVISQPYVSPCPLVFYIPRLHPVGRDPVVVLSKFLGCDGSTLSGFENDPSVPRHLQCSFYFVSELVLGYLLTSGTGVGRRNLQKQFTGAFTGFRRILKALQPVLLFRPRSVIIPTNQVVQR
jgi:signal transduction histidine kinase/GAF domain-containing protein